MVLEINLSKFDAVRYVFGLPGHDGPGEQGDDALGDPEQPAPPWAGVGVSQARILVFDPVPHVTLQADQTFHIPQPPFTTMENVPKIVTCQ